jgi:hypothetical protein
VLELPPQAVVMTVFVVMLMLVGVFVLMLM